MSRSVTTAEMRSLDQAAIQQYRIPALVLMENAGAGATRAILARCDSSRLAAGVLVIAGNGNNGGDGFVVARHLHNSGHRVAVAMRGEPSTAEARTNHEIVRALGLPLHELDAPQSWPSAGCVVDSLLGIGCEGDSLREPAAGAVRAINEAGDRGAFVVALDVPTGLNADTGRAAQPTVRAALTATFGAVKRGLLVPEAAQFAGEIVLIEISLPPALLRELPSEGAP